MPWWAWLLMAVALTLFALSLGVVALWRSARRDSERSALAKRIIALPWRAKLTLIRRLFRDRRVPRCVKVLLLALAVYLALPLDLIPDFIPVIGYLDDLLVVLLVVSILLRAVPVAVVEDNLDSLVRGEG
jgi:uncharacterized membrane protein YkvA (DUF1232 family)